MSLLKNMFISVTISLVFYFTLGLLISGLGITTMFVPIANLIIICTSIILGQIVLIRANLGDK